MQRDETTVFTLLISFSYAMVLLLIVQAHGIRKDSIKRDEGIYEGLAHIEKQLNQHERYMHKEGDYEIEKLRKAEKKFGVVHVEPEGEEDGGHKGH